MANAPRHYLSLPEPTDPSFRKKLLTELKIITDQLGMASDGTQSVGTGEFASEAPQGLIDSANKTYTISFTPAPNSGSLYKTGLFQRPGGAFEYTLSGRIITMATAPINGVDWLWFTGVKS